MHVDPDLQPECPQCGCEVLFDVQVDGVLVQSEDGLAVRFPVREGRTQVMRAVPLLEQDLDIDCSHCGFSGFLGDVLEEFGPVNRPQPGTTVRRRPLDPDLQPICPRCECEGMFEILVSGVLIQTANGPVVRYPTWSGGHLQYNSSPLLDGNDCIDCPHCRHSTVLSEVYGESELSSA